MTGDVQKADGELQARHKRLIEDACAQAARVRLTHCTSPGQTSGSVSPEPPAVRGDPDSDGPPPDSFTGYQLIREIHRGGQGIVYQAMQESTKRKVAIKVMKEGPFASTADKARFDREVQILAQLQHPNIVAIHDTGVARGYHYFVMDYIRGQPLDVYMAAGQRGIEETLCLFASICDAVNAAHLRGVIHRDLKPSNIRINGNGEPHVLDFGLAKMAASPSDASMMTVTGAFMGSPPWASPEQAEGVLSKIDMRTDVYSLGVILYQMLTGKLPYDVTGNMREVLDRIQKAVPQRPSAIRRGLNDEVDTIVLKCLAKERERRYQTSGELGRDVRHYLAGDPIEAKRDSVRYVLFKQLRKFKLAATVAGVFVVVVTIGFVTSLTLWRQAEQRQAEAETVTRFLSDTFASVHPSNARGREVSVREILDNAGEDIEKRLADQPLVKAAIRGTIGSTYMGLGLYGQAESHLRAAYDIYTHELGDEHADTLRSRAELATLLWRQGNYAAAEKLVSRTLEIRRHLLGEEHPDTLRSMNTLSNVYSAQGDDAAAEKLLRHALAVCRGILSDEAPLTLILMNNLGSTLYLQGNYIEAEMLLRKTLEIRRRDPGDRDPSTLRTMDGLGLVLGEQGKYSEAEALHREALELSREVNGYEHPETTGFIHVLANVLAVQGKLDEARTYIAALIPRRKEAAERLLTDPESLNDCAWLLLTCEPEDLRDPEAALPMVKKAVEISGGPAPRFLYTLALAYHMSGQIDKAIETQKQAFAALSEVDTAYRTKLELTLVSFLREKGDHQAADSLLDQAVTRTSVTNGTERIELVRRMTELALLLQASGKHALYGSVCRALNELRRGGSHQGESGMATALVALGSALIQQEKFEETDAILSKWLDIQQLGGYNWMKEHSEDPPDRLHEFIERVVKFYEVHEGANPGNGYAEKAAQWRAKLEEMETSR